VLVTVCDEQEITEERPAEGADEAPEATLSTP
jgi:hypothetical protein